MDREDFSAERPALSIPELQDLAKQGATPAQLIEAAGVPAAEVNAVLASIGRRARIVLELADAPAEIARIEQRQSRYESLDAWVRSGNPAADWGIVMLPRDFSEREIFDALMRILARMKGGAIHRDRWRANRDAILAACEDFGIPAERLAAARDPETVSLALAAVRDAVGSMTPDQTRNAPEEAVRRFRSALQRLACDFLLPGHDWKRSRYRTAALSESLPAEDPAFAVVEARATIDALMDRAPLTPGERAVLDLDLDGMETAAIAEALDTTEAAVYTRRNVALDKLRKHAG
jgi:hypothetical protein